MASNYRNGADLERAARKSLEADGYYVIRSAGSKGVVDLAAFKPGQILFVQCKVDGKMTGTGLRELLDLAHLRAGAEPIVAGWHKEGRAARVVRFRHVRYGVPMGVQDWTADHEPEWTRIRAARMTYTDPRPEA